METVRCPLRLTVVLISLISSFHQLSWDVRYRWCTSRHFDIIVNGESSSYHGNPSNRQDALRRPRLGPPNGKQHYVKRLSTNQFRSSCIYQRLGLSAYIKNRTHWNSSSTMCRMSGFQIPPGQGFFTYNGQTSFLGCHLAQAIHNLPSHVIDIPSCSLQDIVLGII